MRQSNAPSYGVNRGIDNAFDGGLVFSIVSANVAAPTMDIDRGTGGVAIGQGYAESTSRRPTACSCKATSASGRRIQVGPYMFTAPRTIILPILIPGMTAHLSYLED